MTNVGCPTCIKAFEGNKHGHMDYIYVSIYLYIYINIHYTYICKTKMQN